MSIFSDLPEASWVAANTHAFAVRDRHPVSPGHTLIITRRATVRDWFEASEDERRELLALVDVVKAELDRGEPRPDGYNVGFNAGEAAGQTVMHLHLHVIPRYAGDVADPRGGIRHVIPGRGNYLAGTAPPPSRALAQVLGAGALTTGGEADRLAAQVLPLFALADDIAIVAAFVQDSGLARIEPTLGPALARGAAVRILTGDYLEITSATALERLLGLQRTAALRESDEADDTAEAADLPNPPPRDTARRGTLEVRVVEVARLPGRTRSFHPKSWRFEAPHFGLAFVGSSNLSHAALDTGIEWNLRVDRAHDPRAFAAVRQAFEHQWATATPLDEQLVRNYAARARLALAARPTAAASEVEPEPIEPLPEPHAVQREALAALRTAREQGRTRALVVLATGLGKTMLAALDYRQLRDEMGERHRPRVLFLAHRRELLLQAARTYRRLLHDVDPGATVGWFAEDGGELSATLVFASVAKLARPANVARLRAERFDYVVVDEVHHAAAESYRRILSAVEAGFLLGLTATPERADDADILGLFDDFVAYRADVRRGIALARLVPFHYFGIADTIDYAHIPWRNRRFDPEQLAAAAETEQRMQTLWRAWQDHPGQRTLIFCASIHHAVFVRDWLTARGLRVAAVFAAEGADDRDAAIEGLRDGTLDAVCAVDVFNEGVDVPSLDRVVMLRPTESSVVFLQQLGRGLRASEGKRALTVIDFVGNHRIFLERLRTLLSLAPSPATRELRHVLSADGPVELPEGCRVVLELEAKTQLMRLFQVSGSDEVERAYRELRLQWGRRPKAGELFRQGYLPSSLRLRHGGWFDFVAAEGDLTAPEAEAAERGRAVLRALEAVPSTQADRLLAVEGLLEADVLFEGLDRPALARVCQGLVSRTPERRDRSPAPFRGPPDDTTASAGTADWVKAGAWASSPGAPGERPLLVESEGRVRLGLDLPPPLWPAMTALVRELMDYRLARARARVSESGTAESSFITKVTWNQRDPILKLPSRTSATLPEGETEVWVDGTLWMFRFAKEFVNVARPSGATRNALGDLVRGWFGPHAGKPGTNFELRFTTGPSGYRVTPVTSPRHAPRPAHLLAAYPDLRAAAGAPSTTHLGEALAQESVLLPNPSGAAWDDPQLFAVRVSGESMNGGRRPLHDGDWAVLRFERSAGAAEVEGRVVLVELPRAGSGGQYQLKRLAREGQGWSLGSDNPDYPNYPADADMQVIAKLVDVVSPDALAPTPRARLADTALAEAFGLPALTPRTGRSSGHLFLFLDGPGALKAPDRVAPCDVTPRPSETAYVLARRGDAWLYLGIGRAVGAEWAIAEVDFETWRALGSAREASRALPDGLLARAEALVEHWLARPEPERWLELDRGGRARILGRAPQGGLRIDGGPGGFRPRTVSLPDLAWALAAADDHAARGGLLDEARVNGLRYLEGTPKASTRYIDGAWAVAAVRGWGSG